MDLRNVLASGFMQIERRTLTLMLTSASGSVVQCLVVGILQAVEQLTSQRLFV